MNNEESKKSKSKIAKMLGGLGVIALVAYNGWVVYNNGFGSGSVQGIVKELLIENIPQCLNEEVASFVELDDIKLDGIADNKWDGEATANLKIKETSEVVSAKFTFSVEKKGSMVYIKNLRLEEGSTETVPAEETTSDEASSALTLDQQFDELTLKIVEIVRSADPNAFDESELEKEVKRFRNLSDEEKKAALAEIQEILKEMKSKTPEGLAESLD